MDFFPDWLGLGLIVTISFGSIMLVLKLLGILSISWWFIAIPFIPLVVVAGLMLYVIATSEMP